MSLVLDETVLADYISFFNEGNQRNIDQVPFFANCNFQNTPN